MKLLVIDDERFTREGLQRSIENLFPEIVQLPPSTNGLEGFSSALENKPDIIVTDIRMPGLDGLDLIEKLYAMDYDCEFVIVSGYDNFEYATRAMKMGVKHYVLKPCKDPDIKREILQAMADVNKRREMKRFLEQARKDHEILAPQIRQQYLNSLIFGDGYTAQEIIRYHAGSRFIPTAVRLFVASGDDDGDLKKALYIRQAIDQVLTDYPGSISTLLGDKIIFVTDSASCRDAEAIGQNMIQFCNNYNLGNVYVAVSDYGTIKQISLLYKQAMKRLEQRFFADGSLVITEKTCSGKSEANDVIDLGNIIDTIVQSVMFGQTEQYRELLNQFFEFLRKNFSGFRIAHTYCIELLVVLLRNMDRQHADYNIMEFIRDDIHTLSQYQSLIDKVIESLEPITPNGSTRNVVQQSLKYIHSHLSDANLSVSAIAVDTLFIRPDYFGKLFKKEIGIKPSTYIRNKRIELAQKLLTESSQKINAICLSCGFGDNLQYFCYVFKQVVGYTPTQFREQNSKAE